MARAGGDEFLAFLQLRDPEEILPVTERIRRRVNDRERQRPMDTPSTCGSWPRLARWRAISVRCRRLLTVDALVDRLIRIADDEMYHSKRDGQLHVAVVRFTDANAMELRDLAS